MRITIDRVESLLREAATRFVSPAEAAYFAELSLETHLRKAPRMNPLEDALNDLKVWESAATQDYKVEVDKGSILLLDFQGLAPGLKIKALHEELEGRARKHGLGALGFHNPSGLITLYPWAEGLAP